MVNRCSVNSERSGAELQYPQRYSERLKLIHPTAFDSKRTPARAVGKCPVYAFLGGASGIQDVLHMSIGKASPALATETLIDPLERDRPTRIKGLVVGTTVDFTTGTCQATRRYLL
jgi:hypothetical protein